ncbi:MAG TPA: tetratricopeptide repeat protein, partial [Herpetosiphonaceae bacterium]|nr:tetratricopeptide repeat protein [Herpetosiphonaceae bacterium]
MPFTDSGPPAGNASELRDQGIAAVRAGDKSAASLLLARSIALDPADAQAWLWLSAAISEPAEQRYCLEQVVLRDPQHAAARRGLSLLPAGPAMVPRVLQPAPAAPPARFQPPPAPPAEPLPVRSAARPAARPPTALWGALGVVVLIVGFLIYRALTLPRSGSAAATPVATERTLAQAEPTVRRPLPTAEPTPSRAAPTATPRPAAAPAAVAPTGTPSAEEAEAGRLTMLALERGRGGDLDGALVDFNAVVERYPAYADAYFYRGALLVSLGDETAGMADYEHATSLDPDPSKAAYHLGRIQSARGDEQSALNSFSKAIDLNPNFDQAYYSRAGSWNDFGYTQQAIDDYTKALALNPGLYGAAYNRANIHYDLDEYDAAIDDYTYVLGLVPDDEWAYNGRADSYNAIGEHQAALDDFNNAIRLAGDEAPASSYCGRGKARNALADHQGAIDDTTRALELDPAYFCAYYTRGDAHYRLGQYDEAIADLSIYLDNIASDNAYTIRGMAYQSKGDYQKAIDDYTSAIKMYSALPEA